MGELSRSGGRLRLVAYLRVSTDTQAERGMGLVVQEKAIRAWCRAQGFRLGHVERDEGVSGTRDAAEREGLRRALEAVEAREAAGVVVYRLDRLARSLTVQEAVLAKVWRDGGRVFATDVGEVARDDPDDPMRTAMRQMFGVFSQLERSLIAARMRAGRRAKADAGGYAGFGSPPFGWQSVDGELLVSDREDAVVRRIRELRADGRSLREVAQVLEHEGHRSKRGERWHPQTVRRVERRLRQPVQ